MIEKYSPLSVTGAGFMQEINYKCIF